MHDDVPNWLFTAPSTATVACTLCVLRGCDTGQDDLRSPPPRRLQSGDGLMALKGMNGCDLKIYSNTRNWQLVRSTLW